ncbi:N-acetylmuramoyl-L-alanine amidase [Lentibacillus salicampi]|uniref:N-acetylmuramoyl-L-alanine amidase n=1 Tax=Lentibacillus salicampi TaxID=175306 RepID=UPI00142F7ADB|nr:N-acetylmuramoyl-L-alanine amidase [Lentibacillus salicampi]
MHFKKSVGVLLFILCFSFTPSVQADKAVVITDDLNIRSGPGTDYERIGQVHTGEALQIISLQNDWVEIAFDHESGWVTREFVDIDSAHRDASTGDTTIGHVISSVTIQHDNTHLREGPSTSYDITGFAKKGDDFDVIAAENNWYKIANGEMSGYVRQEFVDRHKPSSPAGLENKTIVIDAGHGGRDVGAIGASGTYEKDFTYRTMQELKKELTMLGAEVVLTRDTGQFVSLASRTSLANLANTDAFISIHYNSFPQAPDITGINTYYYHKQSEELARFVQEGLINKTEATDREALQEDYYVIRQNFNPSILVELGFISNSEQEQRLQTTSYQKQLVSGMVTGLTQYFK